MNFEIIKHSDDGKYHLRTIRPGFTACCKLIIKDCIRNAKPPTTLSNEHVLCRICYERVIKKKAWKEIIK